MARFSPPSCGVQVNKLWYKPVEQFILPEVRGVMGRLSYQCGPSQAWVCARRGRCLIFCSRTAL